MSWQLQVLNAGLRLLAKPLLARTCDPVLARRRFARVARGFRRADDQADGLDVRHHEEGVADREERGAIDHHAIEKSRRFGDEFAKGSATQKLGRVGRPPATGENG